MGIEIEMEGFKPGRRKLNIPLWEHRKEDSLRNNGAELVTLPLFGEDLITALSQFKEEIVDKIPTLEFGERTSTHVHMDVRDLSVEQLSSLIELCFLLDKAMFSWVGNNRASSVYCMPLITDDMMIGKLADLLVYTKAANKQGIAGAIDKWPKYSSVNIKPILQYGSVEFRHHWGTADKDRILEWVNIIQSIKHAAIELGGKDILALIREQGIYQFFTDTLQSHTLLPHIQQGHILEGCGAIYEMRMYRQLREGHMSLYRCSRVNSAYKRYNEVTK